MGTTVKPERGAKAKVMILWGVYAVLLVAVLVFFREVPLIRGQRGESLRETEEYADLLMNRELYSQAAEAYKEALLSPGLSRSERVRLNHLLATVYLENLKDLPNALARFEKVRQLDPQSDLGKDAGKKIVQCLEGMGKSLDAQVEMEQSVALKPRQGAKANGPVVAKVGEREITLGEVEARLNQLPPALRSKISKPEDMLKFVQEYVVTELLADAARRKGYDANPEVNRAVEEAKKSLMVQKLLEEKIARNAAPSEEELRKYYETHKQKYAVVKDGKVIGTKAFEAAKLEVGQDLLRARGQQEYQRLVLEQLKAQDVKLFTDKIAPRSGQ